MLFRCTRFFLVEWKYPTIFFSLFFLFFSSLSLSFSLGVASERSIEESTSWKERRRGEKNMARVLRRSNFSLHFFVHQSEGGNRGPCRMSAVANEIRRNRNGSCSKIEHPTLSSFACHFWQEKSCEYTTGKEKRKNEMRKRERGGGERKRRDEGGKSQIN